MATIAPTPPRSREGDEHVPTAPHAAGEADRHLLAALRRGDEVAFRVVVERHHAGMVRVARGFVPTQAVAEEVAQEAWLGVLDGLTRFEGRSSLRTWIFSILVKRAKTRGERERRTIPFSALARRETDGEEPAVDPDRFLGLDDRWAGHWACAPKRFEEPAEWLAADETRAVVRAAVDELPPAQRTVISLRDLEGWDASEVCALLGISDGNQRVLLHRARAKVRAALEGHLDQG
jgi:RNA polymerase sigma-70 factor (ECF subfamily)